MGVKIGDYIEVKTITKDDVFGTCVYKIVGPTIEKECPDGKTKHLTKCVLVESSKHDSVGMPVWDELTVIDSNIVDGITRVMSPEEVVRFTEEDA